MNNPKFSALLEELIETDEKNVAKEQRQQQRQQAQESTYDALGRKGSTLLYEIANDPQVIDVLQRYEEKLVSFTSGDKTPYIPASKEICEYKIDAEGTLQATNGVKHLPLYSIFTYGMVYSEPAVIIIGPKNVSLGRIRPDGKVHTLNADLDGCKQIYSLSESGMFVSRMPNIDDVRLGNIIAGNYGTIEEFREDVYDHVTKALSKLKGKS